MVISLDSYFEDMVNDFTDTYSLILSKILPKDLSSDMIDIFDGVGYLKKFWLTKTFIN